MAGFEPKRAGGDVDSFCARFLEVVQAAAAQPPPPHAAPLDAMSDGEGGETGALDAQLLCCHVRPNPLYTLAAIRPGVYLLGMKDQFNKFDLPSHPLGEHIQYVADEAGYILFDRSGEAGAGARGPDAFGPYCIAQYLLMEALSKPEVATNVIDYYVRQPPGPARLARNAPDDSHAPSASPLHSARRWRVLTAASLMRQVHRKQKLTQGAASYSEAQGKGFVCWRFIHEHVGGRFD